MTCSPLFHTKSCTGSKFWLNVLAELKNSGLNDILIIRADGLKGFPDAINTVYPETHI
ncbi:transposase [Escherichia coli]